MAIGTELSPMEVAPPLRRLAWLFTSPVAAFHDIAIAPHWRTALALLMVLALVVGVVEISRLDVQDVADRALAQQQSATPEEAAGTTAAVRGVLKAMILAGPLLVALYLAATSAALFVGLHLLRAGIAFGSVFATVVHAAVPPALCKGLLALAVVLKRDTLALDDLDTLVVSNIAAFLPEDAPRALRVAGDALDLFAVWKWVLIVIGLAIVSRVSRRNAALLAGGVWGGWLAIRILLPSLRS